MAKGRFASLLVALVSMAVLASPGHAAPITLEISYTDTGLTGTAFVTFDDSLLVAGTSLSEGPPTSLQAFSLTLHGLVPDPTTFDLSDLTGWRLEIGSTGGVNDIVDINFSMYDEGGTGPTNADGLSIQGVQIFSLAICEGAFGAHCLGGASFLGVISVQDIRVVATPTPMTLELVGTGLLVVGLLRRRRT